MATLGQSMLRVSSKRVAPGDRELTVNPVKEGTDGHGSETTRLDGTADVETPALRELAQHLENLSQANQFGLETAAVPLDTSVLGSADNQTNPTAGGQSVFADPTGTPMQTISPLATPEAIETRQDQTFLREGYGVEDAGGALDPSATAPPASRYVSRVLRANRFAGLGDEDRLTPTQGDSRSLTARGRITADQKDLGAYATTESEAGRHLVHPPAGKGALQNGSTAAPDEVQLRNVAIRLMVEATGHKGAAQALAKDTRPSNLRSQGRRVLPPSGVQLGGSRVDGDRLQAGAGITSTPSSARRAEALGYSGEFVDSGDSVGTLTSPLEQYGDGLGGGLFFQALAGAVALLGASTLFSLIKSPKKMSLAEVAPGSLGKGIHRLVDTPGGTQVNSSTGGGGSAGRALGNAAAALGAAVMPSLSVPQTTHDFNDCVAAGIRSFYGIDGSGGGFTSLSNAPGFYASIMRTVVRDLEGVANAARGVRSRPFQGLQDFANEIVNSKTFQFLGVMASLGDAVLSSADGSQGPMGPSSMRLSSGMLDTAVSGRTGLRLLPESMISSGIVSQLMGNSSALEGITAARASIGNLTIGRITSEMARNWEGRLDAEYFPFTLHDLRTQEIVSLNAFVTEMQDSFTPSYKTTSGFGRVDDVLTYEKTSRQIQLGFYMVAANPTDHGVLWDTINKIVTLVYPQWSKGRLIKKGETSFRVPFSQVITASPMIRLRFGETITGNYTRFGLMRLFGSGEATQGASVLGLADATSSALATEVGPGAINSQTFEAGAVQLVEDAARVAPFRFNGFSLNDNVDTSTETVSDVFKEALFEAAAVASNRLRDGYVAGDSVVLLRELHVVVDPTESDSSPADRIRGLANRIAQRQAGRLITKVSIPAGTLCEIVGSHPDQGDARLYKLRFADGEFIADHNSLALDTPGIISEELNAQSIRGDDGQETSYDPNRFFDFQQAVKAFFNPDNNPIVRSFESGMSKGLAGFITSLSFDYSDSTYETAQGSRAPIMVKVSMGFTPVHDIAPGLDADGYNRAPLYQVGRVSRLLAGIDGRNSIDFQGDGSAPTVPQAEQEARAEALRRINEQRADEQTRIDAATQGARDSRDRAEREAARRARSAAIARQRAADLAELTRLQVEQAELEVRGQELRTNAERLASGAMVVQAGVDLVDVQANLQDTRVQNADALEENRQAQIDIARRNNINPGGVLD